MSDKDLELSNLTIKTAHSTLFSLSARVAPGEVLTIMGPSGVGKSTLLNAIAGFLPRSFALTGDILLGGQSILSLPAERRRVGLLFQDPLLFPHLSVEENVLYAIPPNRDAKARVARADALLDAVNLLDCADRDPATLSGGQQARVALVRVLASGPQALLLDEPFSKLDTDLRASVRELVFGEISKRNLPTILVTHDRDDAAAAGGPSICIGC